MAQPILTRFSVVLAVLLMPLVLHAQQPDESMPASIPAAIIANWEAQDGTDYTAAITKIKAALPAEYAAKITGTSSREDYLTACHWRRVVKMKPYMGDMKKVLYAKHFNFGGPLVGFLEGIGMARGNEWAVGSGLYILNMNTYYPTPEVLIEDAKGVIKDPCVSFDGKKVIFAWSQSGSKMSFGGSGFHLFEIDVASKTTRQITSDPEGIKISDYEPCYLPSGDIMFMSCRHFGMIDCAYNIVSNLYMCNRDGKWLRRIGYDQVHTFYPQMMSDGKVIYTRWEYNDRNLATCGGYFTMNPDGTAQTEYWGNQSDFPLMKYHGREIPGSSGKIMGIAGDHHAPYQGELMIVDPVLARNGKKSIKLIAPPHDVPSGSFFNTKGNVQYLFQNPWPFDEQNFLVSWRSTVDEKIFKIYFMNADASRELVAWNDAMSVSQPVVMDARPIPTAITPMSDYNKNTASFSVANVYYGAGSKGVKQGSIKKLRVIGLHYRVDFSQNTGKAGYTVTPLGRSTSSWEAKTVLGEIPIESDGSAAFIVPARVPIFFQTVDSNGCMINSMRSWSTLQPGERFDCFGCHEDKNAAPPSSNTPIAVTPEELLKPIGIEGKSFSFPKMVQPILDKHCIKCHDASHEKGLDLRANPVWAGDLPAEEWSAEVEARKTFNMSYLLLAKKQRQYVDWLTTAGMAAPLTRFPVAGSNTSPLIKKLREGHNSANMTKTEMEILSCWIDFAIPHSETYSDGMSPTDSANYENYVAKNRTAHEAWESTNIAAFIAAGQWRSEVYGGTIKVDYQPDNRSVSDIAEGTAPAIRLIPVKGGLMVQCPAVGTISLVDLKGRLVMDFTVTNEMIAGSQATKLPGKLPAGLYIVRFKGRAASLQRVVSVM
ncbi:MAG: hypothetical protein JW913_09715 [Chitinispirillaceae bacterium]|nr:hypothetical protein [Chitinispirillaceae bacterium]